MLWLTAAYPVVFDCFGSAQRMGMVAWRCSPKLARLFLRVVIVVAEKIMTLGAMSLTSALMQAQLP